MAVVAGSEHIRHISSILHPAFERDKPAFEKGKELVHHVFLALET